MLVKVLSSEHHIREFCNWLHCCRVILVVASTFVSNLRIDLLNATTIIHLKSLGWDLITQIILIQTPKILNKKIAQFSLFLKVRKSCSWQPKPHPM